MMGPFFSQALATAIIVSAGYTGSYRESAFLFSKIYHNITDTMQFPCFSQSKHVRWLFFSILFFLFVTSFKVTSPDINMDGMVYASIARNMAEGFGDLWRPFYTATFYHEFYENLGFAMWMQSFAFKLIGDSFLIERISGIILIIGTFIVFASFLKKLSMLDGCESPSVPMAWFIVLYASIPIIIYSATGNLLETSMTFFVILSCWFLLHALKSRYWYILCFLSSVVLTCAILSKTFSALFVLAFYPFLWMVYRQKVILHLVAQLTSIFVICFVLFSIDGPRNAIVTHFTTQLLPSLTGVRATDGNHFYLIKRFFCELGVPLALAILLTGNPLKWKMGKKEVFLVFIGLSGFLPLLLSSKQNTRYLIPVLPFFCGALALSSSPALITKWYCSKKADLLQRVGLVVFPLAIIVIASFKYGNTDGYEAFWNDVGANYQQFQKIGRITVTGACYNPDWEEIAFYQRHFKWSFSPDSAIILDKKSNHCPTIPKDAVVVIENNRMRVWSRPQGADLLQRRQDEDGD